MATEIERKFLLVSDDWRRLAVRAESFRQGYLSNSKRASVRVRVANDKATLNIKGMTIGIERPEYEYGLPLQDAAELLDQLCERPLIEKTRHFVEFGGKLWEIDEFHGDNAGLVVAEVELASPDEAIAMPEWVGKEVSHLERYYNVRLTQYPYSRWTAEERG
ncbi:CYTH domain-containing protein [Candidatus Thiothrix sp. Deng01]|uniref:CYTH domain-containing protein n=1 Tax=Candidatus Thiothrix phosphatis TaxID=3112415 RepID=A0ABU6CU61_9GAMM|nr:CYTH domain-containing protein [Candidatus Thiothrix sp. Deng01]MEB4589913.1 CYTH domain-containing protein [Candidatus Thiothrix sp. Deng01]